MIKLPGYLLALWLVVPGADAAPAPHTSGGDCRACHTDTRHPLLTAGTGKTCLQCHDSVMAQGLLRRVALHEPAESADTADSGNWPHAEGQGPGMSVPMYYDETRISAEPNAMVAIPAGEFVMGTRERMSDEGPPHKVRLKTFSIDKFEVTNLQYKKFIDATQHRSPEHFENRSFPPGKADHPVTFVSWYDAQAYCTWAGKRLPSDAEWEKAARGTDQRRYPWGNSFDVNKVNSPVRWATLKLQGDTTPVGAFEGGKSAYGAYDLSGNAWEWTDSWYLPYPGNKKLNENYGEKYKTLKGGSWWDCSFYRCGISAPTYNRAFFLRNTKNASFGFRCAKDDK